ncbi:MAG TPA: hypothetical protein VIK99_11390 [Thermaerobacter sp.]
MHSDRERALHRLREELRRPLAAWEWLLEAVALAGLVTALGIVAASWRHLPDRIPTQFLFTGRHPDYRGDPLELLFFLGIQVTLYALLSGAFHLLPDILNYPRPMTEETAPRWATAIRFILRAIKAYVMCLQAHMVWITVAVSRRAVGPSPWVKTSLIAFPVLVLAVMWLATRPRRQLR